jgi:hypothetical protein
MISAAIQTAILAIEGVLAKLPPHHAKDYDDFLAFLRELKAAEAKSETWMRWRTSHRAQVQHMPLARPVVALLEGVFL